MSLTFHRYSSNYSTTSKIGKKRNPLDLTFKSKLCKKCAREYSKSKNGLMKIKKRQQLHTGGQIKLGIPKSQVA